MFLVGVYVAQVSLCIKVRLINRLIFLDWILAFVFVVVVDFFFYIVSFYFPLFFVERSICCCLCISLNSFHLYLPFNFYFLFFYFSSFISYIFLFRSARWREKKILKLIRNEKRILWRNTWRNSFDCFVNEFNKAFGILTRITCWYSIHVATIFHGLCCFGGLLIFTHTDTDKMNSKQSN